MLFSYLFLYRSPHSQLIILKLQVLIRIYVTNTECLGEQEGVWHTAGG